ncbi:MAG: protein kinase [Proteobacteria bacterium]|nr:protein kinase [Pseudomonadota bacterium]MBU1716308.1 protein kinase [Pseudomonadota bacterium]
MSELTSLGKYKIESVLGQGAMGIVYKGFDPVIERTVALKTIRKDSFDPKDLEQLLARFKREAQAAGRLAHPNIVTVYEYGEEGNQAFIAMEFVEGRDLKEILDRNEKFAVPEIVKILSQLLDALAYSHDHGVIHRDIKPGNIILLNDGRIKVTDFGIARIESSNLTQFGDVMGTPSYMSPEQFMGQRIDNRSDLFSAGVILYHLLTGEKPFPGDSVTTIMHRLLHADPIKPADLNFQISSGLNNLVIKALAKKPEDRFQSAKEFNDALQKAPNDNSRQINTAGDDTILMMDDRQQSAINERQFPSKHSYKKHSTSKMTMLIILVMTLVAITIGVSSWIFIYDVSLDDLDPTLAVNIRKAVTFTNNKIPVQIKDFILKGKRKISPGSSLLVTIEPGNKVKKALKTKRQPTVATTNPASSPTKPVTKTKDMIVNGKPPLETKPAAKKPMDPESKTSMIKPETENIFTPTTINTPKRGQASSGTTAAQSDPANEPLMKSGGGGKIITDQEW